MKRLMLGCIGLAIWVAASCTSAERQFGGGPHDAGAGDNTGASGTEQGAPAGAATGANGGADEHEFGVPLPGAGGSTGGDPNLNSAGDGSGGTAAAPPAPPSGAFAWYKASESDVALQVASLSDGNDFIKSYWAKTNLTAEALQPDSRGGTTATALYDNPSSAMGVHSMKHSVGSVGKAPMVVRLVAKMGERRYLLVTGGAGMSAVLDLLNGEVASSVNAQATLRALDGAWYECAVEFVVGSSEVSIGVSATTSSTYSALNTTKPAVWLERVGVEQTSATVWHDRISGRDLVDETGSYSWLASTESMNGLPSLHSHPLGNPLVAGAPDDWRFLHDGTGGTVVIFHDLPSPMEGYRSVGTEFLDRTQGAHIGVSDQDSSSWTFSAMNSAAEPLFVLTGGHTDGASWLAGSYGGSAEARLFQDGTLVASGKAQAEPSIEASKLALQLGDRVGSPDSFVHEVIVFARAVDATDVAELKRYFDAQLGR